MPVSLEPWSLLLGLLAGSVASALVAWWLSRGRLAQHAEAMRQQHEADVAARTQGEHALNERNLDLQRRLDQSLNELRKSQEAVNALTGERAALAVRLEQLAPAHQLAQQTQIERDALARDLASARERAAKLHADLEAQTTIAQERLALLQKVDEQLKPALQNLAAEILEDKSKRFTEHNSQQLGLLLTPLREQLTAFGKTVADTHASEQRERGILAEQISALRKLNQQIGEDAVNLTRALKGDSKTQGTWGELLLQRVLEASGLVEGREYELQQVFKDDDGGRPRPDVIVRLPDNKDLVIDAKVSLTAYERYCSAIDDAERATQLQSHVDSMKRHIASLSQRNYTAAEGLRTLDFVLMFVPVEAAFIDALRRDDSLYEYALSRQIALVSPSTLLATLRTVSHLWQMEKRSANATEIAKRAGRLHDSFVELVNDLRKIGDQLGNAQRTYDGVFKRLSTGKGNLLRRAEQLRELGADTGKVLPEGLLDRALEDSGSEASDATDDPAART